MARYFVSAKAHENGGHNVHAAKCGHMPAPEDRIHLGNFNDCRDAVVAAKKYYPEVEGCNTCCRACHAVRTGSTVPAFDSTRHGAPLPLSSFGG